MLLYYDNKSFLLIASLPINLNIQNILDFNNINSGKIYQFFDKFELIFVFNEVLNIYFYFLCKIKILFL
jgi:hypothetical protein